MWPNPFPEGVRRLPLRSLRHKQNTAFNRRTTCLQSGPERNKDTFFRKVLCLLCRTSRGFIHRRGNVFTYKKALSRYKHRIMPALVPTPLTSSTATPQPLLLPPVMDYCRKEFTQHGVLRQRPGVWGEGHCVSLSLSLF